MELGETRLMRDGRTFTMTAARIVGNRKSGDMRKHVRFQPLRVHEHAHPLVRALVAHLNKERLTLSDVAARCGVDRRVMHKWRIRSNPSLNLFCAALDAAGLELRIVRKKDDDDV